MVGSAATTMDMTNEVAITDNQKNANQLRFLVTADLATNTADRVLTVIRDRAEGSQA